MQFNRQSSASSVSAFDSNINDKVLVKASIVACRHRKEDSGWSIFDIKIAGTDDTCKAVGILPAFKENCTYEFLGTWVSHPIYGEQFKFDKANVSMPTSSDGIVRYLSTTVKGVGAVKAAKIVAVFGDDTLSVIQTQPERLSELEFLTDTQKEDVCNAVTADISIAKLADLICRDGIGMGTVHKIHDKYGERSVAVIKENPYILTDELFGVGFKTADNIAMASGINPASPVRREAALVYMLNTAAGDGHVYLKPSEIVSKLLGKGGILEGTCVDVDMIKESYEKLLAEKKCIRDDVAVYGIPLYEAETNLAAKLSELVSDVGVHLNVPQPEIDKFIACEEAALSKINKDAKYAKAQRDAIVTAFNSNLSVITGGPGTGKTTVINAICNIYKNYIRVMKFTLQHQQDVQLNGCVKQRVVKRLPYIGRWCTAQ